MRRINHRHLRARKGARVRLAAIGGKQQFVRRMLNIGGLQRLRFRQQTDVDAVEIDPTQAHHHIVKDMLFVHIAIHQIADKLRNKPGLRAEIVQIFLDHTCLVREQKTLCKSKNIVELSHL